MGVLIYSDPRDDGFVTFANGFSPYPAGPARNPTAVQRGSAQYLSFYPGDPTTPGYPSYEDAERTEGSNIPTIPSLPISWANGKRLLEEIDGLYLTTEDGSRKLSGKSSLSKVKLVNHGKYRVVTYLRFFSHHLRSRHESDAYLEYDGCNTWSRPERGCYHRLSP